MLGRGLGGWGGQSLNTRRASRKTSIVQQRGRDHGKGNSRAYYVADHMIDARSQTGTAPDEQTAMRYPTRASELDHRRLQVPPSPLHDPSPDQLHAGVENVPVVPAVLDKGHQSKRTRRAGGRRFRVGPRTAILLHSLRAALATDAVSTAQSAVL